MFFIVFLLFFSSQTEACFDSNCECRNISNGIYFDCTNQQLSFIPSMPKTTTILNGSGNNFPKFLYHILPVAYGTVEIILQHCNIQILTESSFANAMSLEKLDISHNNISTMSPNTFQYINNIIEIDISHNKLEMLNESYFGQLNLHYLDLSSNGMSVIANDVFTDMSVRSLNLSANSFSHLSRGILPEYLRSIRITHNAVPLTLDPGIFEALDLDVVDVKYSKLRNLDFIQHTSAVTLDLSGNSISNDISLPTSMSNRNVRKLYINDIGMFKLKSELMNSFPHLTGLYAAYNNIFRVPTDILTTLPHLQVLDLSENNISILPEIFSHQRYLQVLNLSNNKIGAVRTEQFSGLSSLSTLDLSRNIITSLPSTFSTILTNVPHVNLSDNIWHCNCEMSWVHASYNANNNFGISQCSTPEEKSLFRMTPAELTCTKPKFTTVTRSQQITVGSSFNFKCNVESDPASFIEMRDNSGEVIELQPPVDRGRTMNYGLWEFSKATLGHSGEYSCMARNIMGTDTRTVIIQVVNASLETTTETIPITTYIPIEPHHTTILNVEETTSNRTQPDSVTGDVTNNEKLSSNVKTSLIILLTFIILTIIVVVPFVLIVLYKRRRQKQEYSPVSIVKLRGLNRSEKV